MYNEALDSKRTIAGEEERCEGLVGTEQCERHDGHKPDCAIDLYNGHGRPWQRDRCFYFAGGNGTRCRWVYGHSGDDHNCGPPT